MTDAEQAKLAALTLAAVPSYDAVNGWRCGLFGGTDGLTASVEAVSFDLHIEYDALGSKEEYVK